MPRTGRPPKPAALHVINGNPSRLPDLEGRIAREPKPEAKVPECPEWLKRDPVAFAEWNRVVPQLENIGLLTAVDGAALEGYCKSYSRWVAAEVQMDAAGSVIYKPGKKGKNGEPPDSNYLAPLPQVAVAQKYLQICKSFISEFGLSPSARARMAIPGDSASEDELEAIINGR